ncbi:MAG: discoidin domain-containing protein [Moraxella sp.]|nr:discoidin domain-containing protein [Moraxella sp.]
MISNGCYHASATPKNTVDFGRTHILEREKFTCFDYQVYYRYQQRLQGLHDIAAQGKASQSSISKWSKSSDEAQLACTNHQYDFAFHTEIEQQAWWMLEFDEIITAKEIHIHNRKQIEVAKRAKNLQVEISKDGIYWYTIHQNTSIFGFNENALIVLLEQKQIFKYLRLSVKNEYLHLFRVEIFVSCV